MPAIFEVNANELTARLPTEHVVEWLAFTALDGGSLADQIRWATNGYLGSSLQPPDFSGEIAAASERLTADTEEV